MLEVPSVLLWALERGAQVGAHGGDLWARRSVCIPAPPFERREGMESLVDKGLAGGAGCGRIYGVNGKGGWRGSEEGPRAQGERWGLGRSSWECRAEGGSCGADLRARYPVSECGWRLPLPICLGVRERPSSIVRVLPGEQLQDLPASGGVRVG